MRTELRGIEIHPIINVTHETQNRYAVYDSQIEDANLLGIIDELGEGLYSHSHGYASFAVAAHGHNMNTSEASSHRTDAADFITDYDHRTFADALAHIVNTHREAQQKATNR